MYYLAVTDGRAPRTPHATIEAATTEARRLAEKTQRRVTVYLLIEMFDPTPKAGVEHE